MPFSPSLTLSEENNTSPKNCQICGEKSHGIHFGAVTCRACAAFFRRAAIGPKFVLKCKNGGGRCEIDSNGRAGCKKCRLKKCKEIGMDMKNFQFDRDPIRTSQKVIPSLAIFLGRPQFLIFCDPKSSASTSTSTFIDLSELLKNAIGVLTEPKKSPLALRQNRLRKLSSVLDINRFNHTPEEEFKLITNIGFKESISFFEHDLLLVSKWLTQFDEFQELSLDVRLKFIKSFWHLWNRLEKLGRTTMYMNNRKNGSWDMNSVLLADDCVLDTRIVNLDIGWLTNYSVKQIGYYIEGIGDKSLFKPLQPILDLNPTDIELNYMLAQISFSYAAKQLDSPYSEIADNFLQLLADDLHDYYTNERDISRYSNRVTKMMKVNNTIMRVLWERKEKLEIARTFDIFHAKYSEPDMFRDIS